MTIVLGIDPGSVTGWARYCTETKSVLSAGQFPEWLCNWQGEFAQCDRIVIERPRVYHGSPPAVGETCVIAGILWHKLLVLSLQTPQWMLRHDVKKTLTEATMGEIGVRNDATAWAALKLLHGGEDSAVKPTKKRQGGPIGGVSSHERAALAVAYAWAIREGVVSC